MNMPLQTLQRSNTFPSWFWETASRREGKEQEGREGKEKKKIGDEGK